MKMSRAVMPVAYLLTLTISTHPFEKDGELLKVLIQPGVEYWQPLL